MSVSIVQSVMQPESSAATTALTFGSSTVSGNTILVHCMLYSNDGASNEIDMAATNPVVDNMGNTYNPYPSGEVKRAGISWYQHTYWYLATNIVGGINHIITGNFQRSTFFFFSIWELSPCTFDGTNAVTNTGSQPMQTTRWTISVGTATPSANNAISFLEVQEDGDDGGSGLNLTTSAGWTQDRFDTAGGGQDLVCHLTQTTATSISFTAQGPGTPNPGTDVWSASGIILLPPPPVDTTTKPGQLGEFDPVMRADWGGF